MSYVLARAQLEDLPSMIEMEALLFGNDAWSPELMVAEVSYPESYYLVARDHENGDLLGYGGLRAALRSAGHGDIQTLAVSATRRRTGLGRAMLRALMAEAFQRGVSDIFLEVRADNEAAIALYSSEGFELLDRRVGYYQPDGVDALVMRLQNVTPQPGWAVRDE